MHHHPNRRLAVLCALLLGTSAVYADGVSMDGWPAWARDSMQAEMKRMKNRTVVTPDDAIRSKLPGKPATPQPMEDGWYFSSDIKAESPLECYLFTSSRDLATLTDVMAEANIEAVAGSHDRVSNRQVFHTEAGEVAGMPYLALEWLYTVERDSEVLVGFTKVRAATKGERAYVCSHNYLGYRATLAKAFATFVENATPADAGPAPFYEEIARLDMNGMGTGVTYASYRRDDDGGIRMDMVESSLMPVDAATVASSDAYTISFSRPDGELINAYDVSVENGEIASNMELNRNAEGNWTSSGTLQGKELAYEIDGAMQPASEWRQLTLARNLFAGDATSVNALVWIPGIDPTQFLEATMTRDDAEVERQAIMTLGPLSYAGRFDASGNLASADMTVGPVTINVERVWSRGALPE